MITSLLFLFFLSFQHINGAVISERKNGVKRFVLFSSRTLEGECLPPCPTQAPTCPSCDHVGLMATKEQATEETVCGCSDCCTLCPEGTYCVGTAADCVCVACECGACDVGNNACCVWHDEKANSCKPNYGNHIPKAVMSECNTKSNRFPHDPEDRNACSALPQLSTTALLNGCGCKPNYMGECNYVKGTAPSDERCFVCDVDDWEHRVKECGDCFRCIYDCGSETDKECFGIADSGAEYASCLKYVSADCRIGCQERCLKI